MNTRQPADSLHSASAAAVASPRVRVARRMQDPAADAAEAADRRRGALQQAQQQPQQQPQQQRGIHRSDDSDDDSGGPAALKEDPGAIARPVAQREPVDVRPSVLVAHTPSPTVPPGPASASPGSARLEGKERYQELRLVGRGNYGTVHLVRDLVSQEELILKKIDLSDLSEAEREQAKQEVVLLSSLRHPFIVRYKSSFLQDGVLHIGMGFCEGGTLADKIKAARKAQRYFEEGQILDWFAQLALAISYIHKRRVLHRDLKTSNCFLSKRNVIQLGDFGVSRLLAGTLEQAKTLVGTPFYMAPEMCSGSFYSEKADMWSLGVILYELACLVRPFQASSLLQLVYRIVQEQPEDIPAHYSDDLRDLIRRLLAKDPAGRCSADEALQLPFVAARLERFDLEESTSLAQAVPGSASKKAPLSMPAASPTAISSGGRTSLLNVASGGLAPASARLTGRAGALSPAPRFSSESRASSRGSASSRSSSESTSPVLRPARPASHLHTQPASRAHSGRSHASRAQAGGAFPQQEHDYEGEIAADDDDTMLAIDAVLGRAATMAAGVANGRASSSSSVRSASSSSSSAVANVRVMHHQNHGHSQSHSLQHHQHLHPPQQQHHPHASGVGSSITSPLSPPRIHLPLRPSSTVAAGGAGSALSSHTGAVPTPYAIPAATAITGLDEDVTDDAPAFSSPRPQQQWQRQQQVPQQQQQQRDWRSGEDSTAVAASDSSAMLMRRPSGFPVNAGPVTPGGSTGVVPAAHSPSSLGGSPGSISSTATGARPSPLHSPGGGGSSIAVAAHHSHHPHTLPSLSTAHHPHSSHHTTHSHQGHHSLGPVTHVGAVAGSAQGSQSARLRNSTGSASAPVTPSSGSKNTSGGGTAGGSGGGSFFLFENGLPSHVPLDAVTAAVAASRLDFDEANNRNAAGTEAVAVHSIAVTSAAGNRLSLGSIGARERDRDAFGHLHSRPIDASASPVQHNTMALRDSGASDDEDVVPFSPSHAHYPLHSQPSGRYVSYGGHQQGAAPSPGGQSSCTASTFPSGRRGSTFSTGTGHSTGRTDSGKPSPVLGPLTPASMVHMTSLNAPGRSGSPLPLAAADALVLPPGTGSVGPPSLRLPGSSRDLVEDVTSPGRAAQAPQASAISLHAASTVSSPAVRATAAQRQTPGVLSALSPLAAGARISLGHSHGGHSTPAVQSPVPQGSLGDLHALPGEARSPAGRPGDSTPSQTASAGNRLQLRPLPGNLPPLQQPGLSSRDGAGGSPSNAAFASDHRFSQQSLQPNRAAAGRIFDFAGTRGSVVGSTAGSVGGAAGSSSSADGSTGGAVSSPFSPTGRFVIQRVTRRNRLLAPLSAGSNTPRGNFVGVSGSSASPSAMSGLSGTFHESAGSTGLLSTPGGPSSLGRAPNGSALLAGPMSSIPERQSSIGSMASMASSTLSDASGAFGASLLGPLPTFPHSYLHSPAFVPSSSSSAHQGVTGNSMPQRQQSGPSNLLGDGSFQALTLSVSPSDTLSLPRRPWTVGSTPTDSHGSSTSGTLLPLPLHVSNMPSARSGSSDSVEELFATGKRIDGTEIFFAEPSGVPGSSRHPTPEAGASRRLLTAASFPSRESIRLPAGVAGNGSTKEPVGPFLQYSGPRSSSGVPRASSQAAFGVDVSPDGLTGKSATKGLESSSLPLQPQRLPEKKSVFGSRR